MNVLTITESVACLILKIGVNCMTLQEYIKGLQELLADNPEIGDVEVVYAKDDEGNGFSSSIFSPSIQYIHKGEDTYHLENLYDKDDM